MKKRVRMPTLEGEVANQTPKRNSTKTAAPVTNGLVPCGAPILNPRAAMALTEARELLLRYLGEELCSLDFSLPQAPEIASPSRGGHADILRWPLRIKGWWTLFECHNMSPAPSVSPWDCPCPVSFPVARALARLTGRQWGSQEAPFITAPSRGRVASNGEETSLDESARGLSFHERTRGCIYGGCHFRFL